MCRGWGVGGWGGGELCGAIQRSVKETAGLFGVPTAGLFGVPHQNANGAYLCTRKLVERNQSAFA